MGGERMFIAHINDKDEYQTCTEHCVNTANFAKNKLESIKLENTAYLSGILHDAGKFSNEFNEYITQSHEGKTVRKGTVIHSFAGCSYILNNYHKRNLDESDVTAEIIAYAIGGHHGLFDCINENGESGFKHRLMKQLEYDQKAICSFFDNCLSKAKIDEIFNDCVKEIKKKINIIIELSNENADELFLYTGLLCRLILSAVIDGDRKDTYNFMVGKKDYLLDNRVIDWNKYANNIDLYVEGIDCKTPIQKARRELSEICMEFADNPTDIYELKLPTGAGKTLSSLRYAVHHASKMNKKRIIYVAPLISILEQNVGVIKRAVGDDKIVLEHHSNIVKDEDFTEQSINSNLLLTENWDSPIVVTTLVQFLYTLYGGKTSQIRRFSSLADSVVILDEVQTVPWRMISLFNMAINFLKNICNTTILLCSATQPTFSTVEHKMFVSEKKFLSDDKEKYFMSVFKRSKIINDGKYKLNEVVDYLQKIANDNNSVLVICNKKTQSEYLYKSFCDDDVNKFHLSASMCMEHREHVLRQIKSELDMDSKVICIATQVIEAGVDISFDVVVRFEAGIDSIVQANGRCNRNGEIDGVASTYVINCIDESLSKLPEIQKAKSATVELLYDYEKDCTKYDEDICSTKSVNQYYNILYGQFKGTKYMEYVTRKYPNTNLFEMLSSNDDWRTKKGEGDDYFLNQAFKTAGMEFEPLDSQTVSVLVPYGEGVKIINDLCSEKARYDIGFARKTIQKAKRYSVSVFNYQEKILKGKNAIYTVLNDSVMILRDEFYDENIGLITEKEADKTCNMLIV